ncbi:MAG: extracellular solute-binding protein [Dehalococcoidia bacterium]|nr:extracellular solute-binding protein [Dehalococcoidia bacterium]
MKYVKYGLILITFAVILSLACTPSAPQTPPPAPQAQPTMRYTPPPAITAMPQPITPRPTPPPQAPSGPAAPSQPTWQQKWDTTVKEAQREKSVLVYAIPGAAVRTAISEAFKKKYGIEVDFLAGNGAQIAARIITERDAGVLVADAIMAGGTTITQVLKKAKIPGSMDDILILPEVRDSNNWRGGFPYLDSEKTAVAMIGTKIRYILRNTDMVGENEITSYKDVLDPKWKGKILVADPTVAGAGASFPAILAQIYGLEGAKDYLRQLVQQEPMVTRDWRQHIEWVAKGKYPIGLAVSPGELVPFLRAQAPVATVMVKEGSKVGSVAGALGVPAKAGHPNASIVFVNWLLSKEGQEVFVKAFGHPSRRNDVEPIGVESEFLETPGEKYIFESEDHYNFQDEFRSISKEIFAPLLK